MNQPGLAPLESKPYEPVIVGRPEVNETADVWVAMDLAAFSLRAYEKLDELRLSSQQFATDEQLLIQEREAKVERIFPASHIEHEIVVEDGAKVKKERIVTEEQKFNALLDDPAEKLMVDQAKARTGAIWAQTITAVERSDFWRNVEEDARRNRMNVEAQLYGPGYEYDLLTGSWVKKDGKKSVKKSGDQQRASYQTKPEDLDASGAVWIDNPNLNKQSF